MTTTKIIDMLIVKAEKEEWNVSARKGYVMFSKYSPYGQDFNFEIDLEDFETETEQCEFLLNAIYEYADNFDPSQEAYYWLDDTGHGKNGAPYEMIDVYKDMVDCRDMVDNLWRVLYNYYYDELCLEDNG